MMVVALSGWGQSEDMRTSREAGFNLHLVKPISFDALDAVLGQIRRGTVKVDADGGVASNGEA
jgi:hypothetical protein